MSAGMATFNCKVCFNTLFVTKCKTKDFFMLLLTALIVTEIFCVAGKVLFSKIQNHGQAAGRWLSFVNSGVA